MNSRSADTLRLAINVIRNFVRENVPDGKSIEIHADSDRISVSRDWKGNHLVQSFSTASGLIEWIENEGPGRGITL